MVDTEPTQLPILSHWDVVAGDWKRIAILGVGNELNGDDAAGVLVARALKNLIKERDARGLEGSDRAVEPFASENDPRALEDPAGDVPAVKIIEAGAAPEAFTGPLRRFGPDLVVFVDAADFGQAPGSVAWLDWMNTDGLSASTHMLPPSVLAEFLARELGCRLVLVGIQPEHLEFDRQVSAVVMQAVNRTSRELAAWLGE